MNAVYRRLEEIKVIADAVVDDEHDCARRCAAHCS
jgi:hypothetical protein